MKFNEIIKSLRVSSGMNQSDFAETIGLKTNTYQAYERGAAEPKIETLCKIADYYGVSVDYLLGRSSAAPAYSPELRELIDTAKQLSGHQILPLLPIARLMLSASAPAQYAEKQSNDTLREAVEREQAEADAELLK